MLPAPLVPGLPWRTYMLPLSRLRHSRSGVVSLFMSAMLTMSRRAHAVPSISVAVWKVAPV
ncbi:hypothetical protein DEJ46_07490 [Streptomyces venezuelae]|uniref:Uncharacterized protein n=1 Tax=Streptomyces venezuelae TaxID=54571 RepID=A0A5P2B365_STRVZ|nr:hypothetical protein DEJ46_07490 [Streptomyces venezuelae]